MTELKHVTLSVMCVPHFKPGEKSRGLKFPKLVKRYCMYSIYTHTIHKNNIHLLMYVYLCIFMYVYMCMYICVYTHRDKQKYRTIPEPPFMKKLMLVYWQLSENSPKKRKQIARK